MLILDSMVLIHFAKLNLLGKLLEIAGGIAIPEGVRKETAIEGKLKGFPDAFEIEKFIAAGRLKVIPASKKAVSLIESLGIRGAEAECIVLARKYGSTLATDDDIVRKRKESLGLKTVGTPALLIQMARMRKLGKPDALSAIKKLRKIGWFSSIVLDKAKMVVENV